MEIGMKDLGKCSLNSDNDKAIYSCIEQLLMTLCLYRNEDYWKLFLLDKIFYVENNVTLDSCIKVEDNVLECARIFYGIDWENVEKVQFVKDEIFCVNLKYADYFLTNTLESPGRHSFLIFREDSEFYYCNDNYYQMPEFTMKKSLVNSIKDIKIDKMIFYDYKYSSEYINTLIIEKFSQSYYELISKVNLNDRNTIITIQFAENIHHIYASLMKDILIIKNCSQDVYCLELALSLEEVAKKIRLIWYLIVRIFLKYKDDIFSMIKEKLQQLVEVLHNEYIIKKKLCSFLEDSYIN